MGPLHPLLFVDLFRIGTCTKFGRYLSIVVMLAKPAVRSKSIQQPDGAAADHTMYFVVLRTYFTPSLGFALPFSRTPPLVYCNAASLPRAVYTRLASRDSNLRCQRVSCSRPLRTRSQSRRTYRLRRKARERRLRGRPLLRITSQTPRSLRTIQKKMVAPLRPLHRLTAEAN